MAVVSEVSNTRAILAFSLGLYVATAWFLFIAGCMTWRKLRNCVMKRNNQEILFMIDDEIDSEVNEAIAEIMTARYD